MSKNFDVSKEFSDIRTMLKNMDTKIDTIMEKIQEFEIIMDAAELIEDQLDRHEDDQDDEEDWMRYDDEEDDEDDYRTYEEY